MAPSACNSQPWKFIVVDDPFKKEMLAKEAFPHIYSIFDFAKAAPVLVVVQREHSRYAARLGATFRGVEYGLIDLGIACEHFILQAEEEGLATCWIGWFNEKGVKKILGIDESKNIDIMISLGHALKTEKREKKRKSLDEIREYH
jgi:nitroreductase